MSAANGSNPRLDRIEKLIEQGELANKRAHDRFEKRHARFESDLRRWGAIGVKEARNQRKRSAEMDKKFDKKMDQLAAAQLITEDKLQQLKETLRKFIESAGSGRNGH